MFTPGRRECDDGCQRQDYCDPADGGTELWRRLGPGLITGAADDDPSGIVTYSQVGAQFGTGMLWTMLFSFPLMAAMQQICARLGRITGAGVAANLRKHYPKPLLFGTVALLCAANIFNLGADIAATGAAAQLLLGRSPNAYAVVFGLVSVHLYRDCLRCSCAMGCGVASNGDSGDLMEHGILEGSCRYPRDDDQPLSFFLAGV
jgi:hypothetical protein